MSAPVVSGEAMLERLWAVQQELKQAAIAHDLVVYRHDAESIRAFVPGEMWEIDVCENGGLDFEVFKSTPMQGEAELRAAIAKVKQANEA